jgi:hypothetical protein
MAKKVYGHQKLIAIQKQRLHKAEQALVILSRRHQQDVKDKDAIRNALASAGAHPASNAIEDIVQAIKQLAPPCDMK